ncbi:hypothetical protein I5J35_gp77 [Mycobacterium phage Rem711]|uniref:Uncharacterized protein n=1 Tax=Mycobacterium phage Rem711 TaxID=2079285 RepID=A0A2K9VF20_9CAUD|nr:hypothetical protein I5J35_gp77 [Mycobacterium phage Rem711]AUV60855.1 hypothetical protein SEA_REM711_77 [Mycobacterium phage Rem711]
MLNRKQRRARKQPKNWTPPTPADSPQEQFRKFLAAPGQMYIINLPGNRSTVMKVRDDDDQFFRFFCAQLAGVLGSEFAVIPATPVDAKMATTQEIAEQTGEATRRVREARRRQEAAEDRVERAKAELDGARQTIAGARLNPDTVDALNAAMNRHPAGKQRSGRHRAPEPETTFDKIAGAGAVDDEDAKRRLASLEIAAAQDQVARAQDELEAANERLRAAYESGGELHNQRVLNDFAQRAAERIAERAGAEPATEPETLPLCEHKTLHGRPGTGPWICNQCGAEVELLDGLTTACPRGGVCPADCSRTPAGCRNAARQAAIDAALRRAAADSGPEFAAGLKAVIDAGLKAGE